MVSTKSKPRTIDEYLAGVKPDQRRALEKLRRTWYDFARIHRQVERAIEVSGIPHTFLRPGSFMQNFVNYNGDTIRSEDTVYLPCGDAREAFVDARDIARVGARALTSGGHEGKAYDLLGPEVITYADAAGKLSAVLGRSIRYVDIPEAEFTKSMLGTGAPEWYVDRLVSLCQYIREGKFPKHSTAIKDVTGRDPISFDQFARDYADTWRKQ